MAFTDVTVTGTYHTEAGAPASGTVTFTLSEPITNSGVTVAAVPVEATLDASGGLSQVLPANDDTDTAPAGSTYVVIEDITGAPTRTYTIVVPSAATGGTVTLAELMPGQPGWG